MEVKVLFFAKILLSNGNSSIYFALKNNELPCLSIHNNSIIDCVQKYNLKRHEEFDSLVNKTSGSGKISALYKKLNLRAISRVNSTCDT